MKLVFKMILIFASFLHLTGCLYVAPTGYSPLAIRTEAPDPCGFTKDNYNRPVRWKKSDFPVVLYVHHTVSDKDAYRNFVSAVNQWNDSWEAYARDRGVRKPFKIFKINGEGAVFSGTPGLDNFNMLFFPKRFDGYTDRGRKKYTQAVTSTSSKSGRMRDADIIVNTEDHRYYFDVSYNEYELALNGNPYVRRSLASTQSSSLLSRLKKSFLRIFNLVLDLFKFHGHHDHVHRGLDSIYIPNHLVDFPSLMIHELGHVVGLAHIPKEDEGNTRVFSVMERNLPKGYSRRRIEEYDLENLFCGYYEHN